MHQATSQIVAQIVANCDQLIVQAAEEVRRLTKERDDALALADELKARLASVTQGDQP